MVMICEILQIIRVHTENMNTLSFSQSTLTKG